MCAELHGPEEVVVPQKKFVFEITRKWTAKKIPKNQAKSFDFSGFFEKKISQKAQRSTILEGGGAYVPPRI